MMRLIAKELREHWLYVAGALVVSVCLVWFGDPALFWRGSSTRWGTAVYLAALFMGLGMYSREHANGTLLFLFSRPVRWWWAYLAKLSVGVAVCLAVAAMAAATYALAAPRVYRPFIDATVLAAGAERVGLLVGFGFLSGFLLSCVVPGMAFSCLVAAAAGLLYLAVVTLLTAGHIGLHSLALIVAPLLIANLLAVRTPLALSHHRRIALWLKVVGGGFLAFCGVTIVLGRIGVHQGEYYDSTTSCPSPDDRFVAYHYSRLRGMSGELPMQLCVSPLGGEPILIDRQRVIREFGPWTDDSRSLVYYTSDGHHAYAKVASVLGGWRPIVICELPPAAVSQQDAEGWTLSWLRVSPSGTWLAAGVDKEDGHEELLAVSTRSGRRVVVFQGKNLCDVEWLDDHRVELQFGCGAEAKVTVVEVGEP